MNCNHAVEQLYVYLDRELTPATRAEVEEHLRGCAECFQHFGFEQAFLKFLEARGRSRGAPDHVKRRIVRELLELEEP